MKQLAGRASKGTGQFGLATPPAMFKAVPVANIDSAEDSIEAATLRMRQRAAAAGAPVQEHLLKSANNTQFSATDIGSQIVVMKANKVI
jgi:hypothetical protein